jgi:hypothetical protein
MPTNRPKSSRGSFALGIAGTLAIGTVLAASNDCSSKTCSPLPCPYPGWDPDTCQCRPGETPPLNDASTDAPSD